MLVYLFTLTQKFIIYNLYFFLLFFFTLLLLLLSYNLYKFKFKFIDYKIYNFNLNSFFIYIYIFIFIFCILLLRYFTMGTEFDIKASFFKFKNLLNEFSYLGKINIIIIIIIFILILNIIKSFFYYQIKKRHLYYYHKSLYQTTKYFMEKQKRLPIKYWDFDFYVTIVHNLENSGRYSYYYIFLLKLPKKISRALSLFFKSKDKTDSLIIKWLKGSVEILVKMLPYILLIIFIFFDIFFNNLKIYSLYYYLPFFFFFQLWKSICLFLEKSNSMINQIIYELYYENTKIYYVDLLEVEYNFVLTYINNNFVCYSYKKDNLDFEMWLQYSDYVFKCCQDIRKQLYHLSEGDVTKLKNPYTGDILDLQDIETTEIWPLLKRKNKNNTNHVESDPFLNFESFKKQKEKEYIVNNFEKQLIKFLQSYDDEKKE